MDRLKVLCFAGTYGLALVCELARLVVRSPFRWYLTFALTALGWLVQTLFLANLAQTAGCINALDVGDQETDWVVRISNFSPPSLLQDESRSTTMEVLLEQYKKFRRMA